MVHSLPLLLLLLFNDFVSLQGHSLLVHQLLPVHLPAGLLRQTLLIGHEQLLALRGREAMIRDTHRVQQGPADFLTPK